LVSQTRVIPEFIGANCRAELIAPAVLAQLENPSMQISAMALTMQRLGQGETPPAMRAAQSVLAAL
jgi:lipid-A-disaccharide synthase